MYFCHRPDFHTPVEETVRAMDVLIKKGKVLYWGTSEWSAAQIMEAIWFAKSEGLEPPMFEQPQYNMLHRQRFEQEYFPLFQPPYNYGTTIWSPLRSGFLTGKYNDGIPEDSRPTQEGYEWLIEDLEMRKKNGEVEIVKQLTDYAAKNFNCSTAQLSLAWCLKNSNVSTILLGATKPEQMIENLGCIEIAEKMNDKHMSDIDSILANKPDDWIGYGGAGNRQLRTL